MIREPGPWLRHAWAVGGTGMLAPASVALAERAHVLSSVASTASSLAALDARCPGTVRHLRVQATWHDPGAFCDTLQDHLDRHGAPEIAMVWVHDADLGVRLARMVAARDRDCRYFHVIGSARHDPLSIADHCRAQLDVPLAYHQVVLCSANEGGRRRWLTDAEIASGVIAAMESSRPRSLIGTPEPWPQL